MKQKTMIIPERRRELKPPFAWIDRRFLFQGFFERLTPYELLLYFFLILVADRDGLSFYSYDKICHLIEVNVDTYIRARNGLVQKGLIAVKDGLFQVLSLPLEPYSQTTQRKKGDFQQIADIFSRLAARGSQF